MNVTLSPRAIREAERCARWWRERRPAARLLFEDELRRILDQIRTAPDLGTIFRSRRSGLAYRRVLMRATRHHVYYRATSTGDVRIVAIWSAVRGRNPVI